MQFEALTGNKPFPWQTALFEKFCLKQFPKSCNIPTGLGKTSTIAIWLLALAHSRISKVAGNENFPRRLVYVVNRRTVVDQATREVEMIRAALLKKIEQVDVVGVLGSLCSMDYESPLAISTLRGQSADNAEWRSDPSRPAVIIGTVDMIGSRLLFTGYGCGYKSRPMHAALLGQDVLLIHDEAHLEPAFQNLLSSIESHQADSHEFRSFNVMEMTATSRGDSNPFTITDDDRQYAEASKRINAKKAITFHEVSSENGIIDAVTELALNHKDSGKAILIFLQKLEHVEKVTEKLRKGSLNVRELTGTLRGFERDNLVSKDPLFARFMRKSGVKPQEGTVYLIATSAGEVGVDLSADLMICDLATFDRMAQRFGRVNRFGEGEAQIDIVHVTTLNAEKEGDSSSPAEDDGVDLNPDDPESAESLSGSRKNDYNNACSKTLSLLKKLRRCDNECYDGCPEALAELDDEEKKAAFAPSPEIRIMTDILLDAWALTSVREKMPGRPPVAEWLHGVAEWQPPETYVAWRDEVSCITGELLSKYKPEDLLEDYPLKPQELLRDRTDRVSKHLEKIAKRCPESQIWIIDSNSMIRTISMAELVEEGHNKWQKFLGNCTVLLQPEAGGLRDGMLAGDARFEESFKYYDVSDKWLDEDGNPRRSRVWDADPQPWGMRLVRSIDTCIDWEDESENDESGEHRYWKWYVQPRSADDDGSRSASRLRELDEHLQTAKKYALTIVDKLGLGDIEKSAVISAAKWHDLGKHRQIWQRSISNMNYPEIVLAKSGGSMNSADLSNYRHELGSVIEVSADEEFKSLPLEAQDLTLHLIAAHHGRARPHFSADEVFDPEKTEEDARNAARETPRRFAQLERKYGRWGLAFIESLVRAADILASQSSEDPFSGGNEPGQRRRPVEQNA